MKYKKVLVMGTGRLPFQCAMYLERFFDQSDIHVLETEPASISVLKNLCNKNQVAYEYLPKPHIEERLKGISEQTLVVSAVNNYLFQPWFLREDNITVINYHNALLPKHRGRNAEAWAIFDGDDETGITWHFVDAGVDTGKIIEQRTVLIEPDTTAISLLKKQNQMAAEVFSSFLETFLNGGLSGTEQARSKEAVIHYSQDIPNNGQLDLHWSVHKMSRFLRAMDYGEIMTLGRPAVTLANKAYKVWRYELTADMDDLGQYQRIEICPGQLTVREDKRKLCVWLKPVEETV